MTKTDTAAPGAPKKKMDIALIDEAIARAKAQKALKEQQSALNVGGAVNAAPKAPKAKKEKPAKEPKAPKAKKEKPAKEPKPEKGPVHLKKVEAAAAALPTLDASTSAIVAEIKGKALKSSQLTALAAHVAHEARIMQTAAAIGTPRPEVGATVTIVSGDKGAAKYVGMSGTLAEVRNIRCFVNVKDAEGKVIKKGLYLFISDVVVTASAQQVAEQPEAQSDVQQSNADAGADADAGAAAADDDDDDDNGDGADSGADDNDDDNDDDDDDDNDDDDDDEAEPEATNAEG